MPASRRSTRTRVRRRRPTYRRRIVRRRVTRYRRRTFRRTSARRILNISSTKKQDTRLCFSTLNTGGVQESTPTLNQANLRGGTLYVIPYLVTAQDRVPGTTVVDTPSYRTASNVFMRGYKETIRFVPNNGDSWVWRRICFTMKGGDFNDQFTNQGALYWEVAPNGWTRPMTQANSVNLSTFKLLVFQGVENIDWRDMFTAKTSSDRITVKSDVTRVLRNTGGNADSRMHHFKLWHPMNSNFSYDDDENGDGVPTSNLLHTKGKAGMGDYYIFDIIQCTNSATSSTMQITPTGTLYWHEK